MSEASAGDVLQRMDRVLEDLPGGRARLRQGRPLLDTDRSRPRWRCSRRSCSSARRSEWPTGESWEALVSKLDAAMRFTGMPNVWWMPIQTRTEMLATGVRSPLGIQVLGPDLRGHRPRGAPDRGGAAGGAGHAQRLRRADRRRPLPRLRRRSRRGRALRPERRGRGGRDRDRHRRQDGRPRPSRGASATRSPCATPATFAPASPTSSGCWSRRRTARRFRSASSRASSRATARRCCATRAGGSTRTSSPTPSGRSPTTSTTRAGWSPSG